MGKTVITVLFEDPFWIALVERLDNKRYDVCKITFGAEPKDYEVYDFLMKNWRFLKFSPSVKTKEIAEKSINPKRMQRVIKKQVQNVGVGTKAQQALKLLQEQNKTVRKVRSREEREAEKQRQFDLHAKKRKEKHKGH